MIILTLRTDKPESEIGLYENEKKLAYETWEAHRQLAETLHIKIKAMLESCEKDWSDIAGIVVLAGPGSFTGLRIGISVVNALAYANGAPIVGTMKDTWIEDGIKLLLEGKNQGQVVPEYGSSPHITQPKK